MSRRAEGISITESNRTRSCLVGRAVAATGASVFHFHGSRRRKLIILGRGRDRRKFRGKRWKESWIYRRSVKTIVARGSNVSPSLSLLLLPGSARRWSIRKKIKVRPFRMARSGNGIASYLCGIIIVLVWRALWRSLQFSFFFFSFFLVSFCSFPAFDTFTQGWWRTTTERESKWSTFFFSLWSWRVLLTTRIDRETVI